MNKIYRDLPREDEEAEAEAARPVEPAVLDLDGADILIVSGYYHPEPTGSAPPISDLSFWLAENGADIKVLTTRPSYPKTEVLEGYRNGERDQENLRGVMVQRLPTHVDGSRGMAGRLRTEFSMLLQLCLARVTGKGKTARHVICVCPSTFVVLAARLFRARGGRVLCIVHDIQSGLGGSLGFGSAKHLFKVLRLLERWAFNSCDVLVALSEEMAAELRALGVRRPIVIAPPQIDVSELIPRPEPVAGRPMLLYSGNLGRKQGLDQVLALAGALLERGSPAQVVIRGEGSERPGLERQAQEAGLSNVHFQDLARREQLPEAMAEGVVHLVPQHPDGATFAVPSKVFSIMAAERPFLATARPGTPLWRIAEKSGGGACVEPYDIGGLADAAEDLLRDPARRRRIGAQGRRYVERHVDRQVVCRTIWEALKLPAGAPPVSSSVHFPRVSSMDAFSRYLSTGLAAVDGWLAPVSAEVIGSIAAYQSAQGMTGSSGEIGVHHGKLFIVLHAFADADRPSFAIDLFEDQHLNSDASGKGDYGQFMHNVEKWAGRAADVKIFKGSSLELDPARVVEACGRARLFSIDGGHTEECTRNDLELAEAICEPYGVVVIDDVFNEFFPEVSMGLHAYIAKGRLRPFAITPNKVLLADPAYAEGYRDHLRARWANRYEKTCHIFGADVDLFGIRYASYPQWKQVLRDSPLYPSLRKIRATFQEHR